MATETTPPRFVEVDGVRLAIDDRGTGAAVVLLHGGGPGCTSRNDFGAMVEHALPGRRVILIDLAQYGESDVPTFRGPMLNAHVDLLAPALDFLGVRDADFLCQSLGGSVALLLAARRPDLVSRMVVTGAQPVLPSPNAPNAALGQHLRDTYYGGSGPSRTKMRDLMTLVEWFDGSAIPDQLVDNRYAASVRPAGYATARDAAIRGVPQDIEDELASIEAPVLLVWGRQDPFAGPGYAYMLAGRIPNADVAIIDRAAHHAQSERPSEYAAIVVRFLGSPGL